MLPNKEEVAEIDRAIKDNGITDPRAKARMIRDFSEGKYVPSEIDSYSVLLHEELTKPPVDGDGFGEHADLVERCISGNSQGTARTELVKAVGKDEADKMLKRFNLSGVADFKTVAQPPTDFKPKAKNDNPFSAAYAKTHTTDQIYAEIGRLSKIMGAKGLAELAAAQGKTIGNQPLRTRAA